MTFTLCLVEFVKPFADDPTLCARVSGEETVMVYTVPATYPAPGMLCLIVQLAPVVGWNFLREQREEDGAIGMGRAAERASLVASD